MQKRTILIIYMLLMTSFTGIFSIKTSDAAQPVLSNVNPPSVTYKFVPYNPRLSIKVNDADNDPLTVIFRTNASGTWQTLGTYNDGNKIYAQNTTNIDITNKTYYWSVNVSDGTNWVNGSYKFIVQPFVRKWRYFPSPHANTSIGPLAVDVNKDGIYEVFCTGVGYATCVNGSTGAEIWRYHNTEIDYHAPFELGDLNNDGVPEMVIAGNETYWNNGKTIALHANDGSVYWIANQESGEKYLGIADIEGNGYPYVYICSADMFHGANGNGRLSKLRGTDGKVLQTTFLFRPCWGGISIADAENDGKFEVYANERMADYHGEGQLNLGMMCYDAETLDLLWYQDSVTASSHPIALVDVNNDDVLDAVSLQQNGGGVIVVDGATWDKIPEYCQNRVPKLSPHSPFPVYDIDNDGNLEIIVAKDGPARMWDLGTWDTYIQLGPLTPPTYNFTEPPKMANVIGDEKLEIIGAFGVPKIFDTSGNLITTINDSMGGLDTTLVQDIDNDWQNELIILTGDGIIQCYDTSAYAPTTPVRTNNQLYSERRNSVGVYVPPPGAPQPIIKTISPLDKAQDVGLNPKLCAHIIDFHYDRMNITISTNATGSWVTLAPSPFSDVGNGWYNVSTSTMNSKNTTYYWRVTATDPYADKMTTTKTYRFTTLAPPTISNIVATPAEVSLGNSVNISCKVTDGTSVNSVRVLITAPDGQKTNTTATGSKPVWTVLKYDTFESGMGSYTDGGSNCSHYTGPTYPHQGTSAVEIQNYAGLDSSFYLTQSIDVDTPRYTNIKIDFWFMAHNMSNLSNFWVKYYDAQHWRIADNYIKPGSQGIRSSDKPFTNDTFCHGITWINESKYTFPTNMKIRFECDAKSSSNTVYIDQVYINATTAQGQNYYLNNTYTLSGIYQYSIWTKDNSGNSYNSGLKSFKISGNSRPYIPGENPTPSNNSIDNNINLIWSIPIDDPDGDAISWTIQCSNGQTNGSTGAANGTKSLSLSGLEHSKLYKVWVNATDPTGSGQWTKRWYRFTTIGSGQPWFGDPSPANGSTGRPLSLTWSIPINDSEGNVFSWTIQCSNGQFSNGTGASNGTKSLSLSGLAYSKTYKVWVNATDPISSGGSGKYTRKWFTFTTTSGGDGGGGGEPPVEPQNKKPIANVSGGEPYHGLVNSTILFNGSKSYDPDGTITKWFWVFGDNTNGTGKIVTHTFLKVGTYMVTLTVTDNKGATNNDTTTCVITPNRPPTKPIITGPINGTKNTKNTYTAVSTDADNNTIQYTFDWGDSLSQSSGFLPNGISFTADHSWATAGRYDVTVTVTDNQTESSSKITVYIDAKKTDDIGYLLDTNGDGIYDTFYSNISKQSTTVQKKDGNYNIDSNGDGTWDYTFDATKGLIPYQQTPGFEIIITIGAIALVFLWKRKSKKRIE